jgi:sigma-B regulation protein RsbU (phosphoserine phosphatase)
MVPMRVEKTSLPPMKILIVDDEPTSRLILDATLKTFGHEVTVATDGLEALASFENAGFPVLISDQLMPGMDGLELCRRIRAAHRPHYTYFILLTSVAGKSGYLEGMRAGADDFITKPFDEEVLAARLVVAERILHLQSQVRQLAGLLPICSVCKKVRDDKNYWHQVESFISRHTEATFTHSYCPDCFNKLKQEIDALPVVR